MLKNHILRYTEIYFLYRRSFTYVALLNKCYLDVKKNYITCDRKIDRIQQGNIPQGSSELIFFDPISLWLIIYILGCLMCSPIIHNPGITRLTILSIPIFLGGRDFTSPKIIKL